ncbi:bifunctional endoribonuclease/protein kinase ire1 [Dipsacomyces acuminosporus]|nr:bifunctional endoribonuclease/protein kinase ire1 [Dipsacomyces acuminosporus]
MSMLSHRNTRALLVPIICVALLIPIASCAEERRNAKPLPASTGGTPPTGFVVSRPVTTLESAPSIYMHDQTTASIIKLAQRTQKDGASATHAPSPTIPHPARNAHTRHTENNPKPKSSRMKTDATTRTEGTGFSFTPASDAASTSAAATTAAATATIITTATTANSRAQAQLHTPGYNYKKAGNDFQEDEEEKLVQVTGTSMQGVALLHRDENGIVPRKYTIPERSVVAAVDQRFIAMLPPKPYHAVASQQNQMKRDMIARSGVSLVDTMIVVTVDGQIHGVSRYDGSIIWKREGLLNSHSPSSARHGRKSTGPRGLVWTRSTVANAVKGSLKSSGPMCDPSSNGGARNVSDTAFENDSACSDGYIEGDEDDDEEEWLLEQGIDWRSDAQVLEQQRKQRREWLAKQKKKACRNSCAEPHASSSSGPTGNEYTGSGSSTVPDMMYIAEPGGSGTIYVYNSEAGLHKLPLTIQDLVDKSPVQAQGTLYTGHKEASFAAIDLATGKLLDFYGEDRGSVTRGSKGTGRAHIKLLLGEKLNRVKIIPTERSSNAIPEWELYHRLVDAPTLDPEVDAILSEIGDAVETVGYRSSHRHSSSGSDSGAGNTRAEYDGDGDDGDDEDTVIRHRSHGPAKFVMTHDGGFVMIEASTGIPLWAQEFDAPVVSVFDVFGISSPDSNSHSTVQTNYVARKRSLSPAAQQNRYLSWRRLHVVDDDDAHAREADIVGIHPVNQLPAMLPELDSEPAHMPALHEAGRLEGYTEVEGGDGDSSGRRNAGGSVRDSSEDAASPSKDDEDNWAWWRYVGHYMTRVAAFIGYAVTIAFLFAFVGAIYLLRPRNKRRPRMWIDAAGDDETRPGRRARLRISWALMHRMWDTLKDEWRIAVEEAWRNPNAAALIRRTDSERRASLKDGDEGAAQELSRQSNLSTGSNSQSTQAGLGRRGSASATPPSLIGVGREDSEPSSFDKLPSGQLTPRRNSTGNLPMTPLKRSALDNDSIERLQPTTPRVGQPQQQQQQQQQRLGAITLSDQVLGYGSHGTVVYRGEFQGRAVAVKRLLLDFYDVADHEVQVLQESDSHPNVIRYFCTERHDHFMYIALELCCGSLADAVLRSPKAVLAQQLLSAISKQKVLYQLARGLHHLHALKLVHRDIKPQNILIAPPPHRRRRRAARTDGAEADEFAFEGSNIVTSGAPRVLISDFGLSRILDDDESSFANTYTMHGMAPFANGNGAFGTMPGGLPAGMIGGIGGGTVGWRAPECFDSPEARRALCDTQQSPLLSPSNSAGADGPTWPSLHGAVANGPAIDEPSPYVSRGTKSRLRHLAMTQTSRAQQQQQDQQKNQQQQLEGDEPDSTGTNTTTTTDRAAYSQLAGVSSSRRRMTRAVDIFSMGCVFYYVLMDGEHPFGERLSREQRILAGSPDLRALEASDNPSATEAVDLIAHMVARCERDRPSAASVLAHPYFWDATQRLGFLQDVSDCLEAEARLIKSARESIPEPPKKTKAPKKKGRHTPPPSTDKVESHAISHESIKDIIAQLPTEQAASVRRAIALLDAFEENSSFVMEGPPPSADGFQVVGMPSNNASALESMSDALAPGSDKTGKQRRVAWDRRLDSHLRRDLGKFRKYDGTRLRDLLRIIRNKKNHYQDMPPQLKEALGDIPDGYLHYFESRFPYLLLHCYYFVLEDDRLRTATVFRPYFRLPAL